jgi:hypothetical protein
MYFLFAIFDIFTSFESAPHRWGRATDITTGPISITTGPIS